VRKVFPTVKTKKRLEETVSGRSGVCIIGILKSTLCKLLSGMTAVDICLRRGGELDDFQRSPAALLISTRAPLTTNCHKILLETTILDDV